MAAAQDGGGFANCEVTEESQLYKFQRVGPVQSSYRAELLGGSPTATPAWSNSFGPGLRLGGAWPPRLGSRGRRPWKKAATAQGGGRRPLGPRRG
eukprot:13685313-Alexandrium_andersonii.AAC.1